MNFNTNILVAAWPTTKPASDNWGDKLNPVLISLLSGLPVANKSYVHDWDDRPVLRVIGSSLTKMRPGEFVWGTGLLNHSDTPRRLATLISAVRGPLSRRRLQSLGIACPEVFGDPAILYPLFYRPTAVQHFDVGVIQHCREAGSIPPPTIAGASSVLHIDICGEINTVIDQIVSCRRILSSSLHGIIAAHAYGIDAMWYRGSDLPLGDGFKFADYLESVGYNNISPILIDSNGKINLEQYTQTRSKSAVDAGKLISSCPFIGERRKARLQKRREELKRDGAAGVIFDWD